MENNKLLFEQLYKDHYEEIYKFIYFYTRNKHDTEDLVEESFIEVWNAIDRIEGNARPLIYRIAKNNVFDSFKSYENKKVVKNTDFLNEVAGNNQIEHEIDMKDLYETVVKKIDLLKPDLKEALMLRYIQDLEYIEISKIMNKTEGAIRILVTKALKQLRIETEEDKKKLIGLPAIFMPGFMNVNFESIKTNIFNKTVMETTTNAGTTTTGTATSASMVSKATLVKVASLVGVTALAVGIAGTSLVTTFTKQPENKVAAVVTATPTMSQTPTLTNTPTTAPTTVPVVNTPTADPYVGWKTYTSTKYNYEFKYPAQYSYADKGVSTPEFILVGESNITDMANRGLGSRIYGTLIRFSVAESYSGSNINKDLFTYTQKDIVLNGQNAVEYITTNKKLIPDGGDIGHQKRQVVLKSGDKYILISYDITENKNLDLHNSIANSFKVK